MSFRHYSTTLAPIDSPCDKYCLLNFWMREAYMDATAIGVRPNRTIFLF